LEHLSFPEGEFSRLAVDVASSDSQILGHAKRRIATHGLVVD
jgi:hypothetical protein